MRSDYAMIFLRKVTIVCSIFFWIVTFLVSAGEDKRAAAPLRAWDCIISTTLFNDIMDFRREIRQEAGERVYAFSTRDGEGWISIAVAIAPAGSRLSSPDYQTAIKAADPANRARNFPKIGARARAEASRFSPDGALSGLIFTTYDGFFDVVVSVFEESSSVERPSLTAEDAARRIEAAYDATRK
jgi:hypothetical protein